MKKLALLLFLGLSLMADKYAVDLSHSNVGFKVKHLMVSNVTGSFKDYSGEIDFDEKSNTFKKFSGVIKAFSINTENEKRDNHLRNSDFFDVEKYPEIKFEMTKQKSNRIYGNLTMRGVTKEVKFDLEIGGVTKNQWGKTILGFSLDGKINREEFGLTYNSVLEAGGVAIGKDVKLMIEIEAIKEEAK